MDAPKSLRTSKLPCTALWYYVPSYGLRSENAGIPQCKSTSLPRFPYSGGSHPAPCGYPMTDRWLCSATKSPLLNAMRGNSRSADPGLAPPASTSHRQQCPLFDFPRGSFPVHSSRVRPTNCCASVSLPALDVDGGGI